MLAALLTRQNQPQPVIVPSSGGPGYPFHHLDEKPKPRSKPRLKLVPKQDDYQAELTAILLAIAVAEIDSEDH